MTLAFMDELEQLLPKQEKFLLDDCYLVASPPPSLPKSYRFRISNTLLTTKKNRQPERAAVLVLIELLVVFYTEMGTKFPITIPPPKTVGLFCLIKT